MAAALAYIALADLDRVAVVAFAGDIVADFPLTRGKDCLFRCSSSSRVSSRRRADRPGPRGDRLRRPAPHPGLAIVVSDLFDPAGFQRGLDLLRHHRYEPHVVQLFDRREADPRIMGDLELFDVETASRRKVTITERNLRQYRQLFEEFQDGIRSYCLRHALGCGQTSTATPFDEFLIEMMRTSGILR